MAQDAFDFIDGFDYISPATGLLPKIIYHPIRLYTPIPDVVPTKGREPFAPRPACGAASLLGQAECGCCGVVDAARAGRPTCSKASSGTELGEGLDFVTGLAMPEVRWRKRGAGDWTAEEKCAVTPLLAKPARPP